MRISKSSHRRLSAEQEVSLGRAIRAAEAEAREAVRGIPDAEEILRGRSRRPEHTRAAEVDRLREAVEAVVKAAREGQLPRERARAAAAAWERSHAMRWELALSAAHVVPPIARQVASGQYDPEDLVSEGYIGLHRAAKRFDPEQGIRFATYARWWARAQMTRSIDTGGRPIRLPGGAVEARRVLLRSIAQREAAHEPWSPTDLADETGLSEDRVRELLAPPEVTSVEVPAGRDGERTSLLDRLADGSAARPDDEADRTLLTERVLACVQVMPDPRLRHVLSCRYGLAGEEPRTLRDIGDELGLSRERTRQLEAKAVAWLREQLGLVPAA